MSKYCATMADYEPKDSECEMCGRENVNWCTINTCNHHFCHSCLVGWTKWNKMEIPATETTPAKKSRPISNCPKCRKYFTMNNVVKLKMGSTNFYPIDLTYDTDDDDEGCNICKPIDLTGKKRRFPNFEKVRPFKMIKQEDE